jgi:anaerobic selenocysteine-containing dehydrogenase
MPQEKMEVNTHAALWLRQRPGTDIAVINGLMHVIISENLHSCACSIGVSNAL